MKTISKLLICFAVLLYISCEKENQSQICPGKDSNPTPTLKVHSNNGNHGNGNNGNHGNGNNGNHFGAPVAQDSAMAMLPDTIFPPLLSDTIAFPQLIYTTGTFAAQNAATGGYTINVSGNYDISAAVNRDLAYPPSNLMLFVNSNMVFDTGPVSTAPLSFQQSVNLNAGDQVYLRTLDGGNAILPQGSFFKLVRN